MNNYNCAICGKPLKQIPAGVSKSTGKPYSSFWACEDRTHKQPRVAQTYQKQEQPVYVPKTPYNANLSDKPGIITDDVKDYNDAKTDSMREQGAKTAAAAYATAMLQLVLIAPEQWEEEFKKKASFIYNHKIAPF